MNRSNAIPIGICALISLLLVGCMCAIAGVGAFAIIRNGPVVTRDITLPIFGTPTRTPNVVRPTPQGGAGQDATPEPGDGTPSSTEESGQFNPATAPTTTTLRTLEDTIVPINDLVELAQRLEGKQNIPETLPPPAAPFKVGDRKKFWATNTDTNENFQVDATLRYVTDHVYFWVQDDVRYDENDMKDLVDTFEQKIYPTDREFFGTEWTPGIDGDPHLYILYATNLGNSLAGYFSSADEYSPEAHEYSNGHEMFLLSADNVSLDEEFARSVLAHEFQHMIHWFRDRNEETWMNEGFSEVAAFLNGYDVGGADFVYAGDPDIQLTDWPSGIENTTPHYGAAFLYLTYFLDRFGEDATKALVAEPENGMVGIDKVLADSGAKDAATGQPISADDVFLDWEVASFLQDGNVGDGRYTYHNYPSAPQPNETESIDSCPSDAQTREVSQYGADYIRIECSGDYTLHFEGSVQVGVVPADPHSGDYMFWSNQGDESDMTLTRSFDFTGQSGDLTLQYWTWYDLEEDYDYLYLEASQDGGKTWEILTTPSGTGDDPSGNSYGWGYNGKSGGGEDAEWIEEQVDISQFAGKQVMLRFEYVTDAAVNGRGLLLDDISVPQIDYSSDFEQDEGGWEGEGFARIQNSLPQTFRLALISENGDTTVQNITLSADNSADIPIQGNSVLVVTGTTRFTREKAAYRFTIER